LKKGDLRTSKKMEFMANAINGCGYENNEIDLM
jgi:hypothetical protein